MTIQTTFLYKALITNIALEFFITIMNSHMFFQSFISAERFLAYGTVEHILSNMRYHVARYVFLQTRFIIAHITRVILLFQMYFSHMQC